MTESYYRIMVNPERCYSIWPIDLAIPPGWKSTGFIGSADVALSQVAELWQLTRARLATGEPEEQANANDDERNRRPRPSNGGV